MGGGGGGYPPRSLRPSLSSWRHCSEAGAESPRPDTPKRPPLPPALDEIDGAEAAAAVRGAGGNSSWTEGGPSSPPGPSPAGAGERGERRASSRSRTRPSAPSHREPSPTIQVGSCPQIPQEQRCSAVGSHTQGPGSGGPRCPSRAPYKPTARPTRVGHEAPPPLATPQATVPQEDARVLPHPARERATR